MPAVHFEGMVFGQSWGTGMWKRLQEVLGMWGQLPRAGGHHVTVSKWEVTLNLPWVCY